LESARDGFAMCGLEGERVPVAREEIDTLNALRRGVFAKRPIKAGEQLDVSKTFFAIPSQPGQLLANDLSKYTRYTVRTDVLENEPLALDNLDGQDTRGQTLEIMKQVTGLLRDNQIRVPDGASCDISHHYGIEHFSEYGATIIDVVNREYCKKLIILLPGQNHPTHHHKKKEETFHVLYGTMCLNLNGQEREVRTGEMVTVERGVPHAFSTTEGAIFEELSTTHYVNDSFYDNPAVAANPARKTPLVFRSNWLTEELK
jgi:quercetin dioxygenase-like cupin family protein